MSNLDVTTRALWSRTLEHEVYRKLPLLNRLIANHQYKFDPGLSYKQTVEYDTQVSLVQEYKGGVTPLSGGKKTISTTVEWYMKEAQLPVEIPWSDLTANRGGGDTQIIPLDKMLVNNAHASMRMWYNDMMWRAGANTHDGESSILWQGLLDALTHDITYGGKTRATTATNKWWQGASLANDFADQATAISPTVQNLRSCYDAISMFIENKEQVLVVTSNPNYRSLQAQVQAFGNVPPGPLAKFGFTSMLIDEIEVVAEPWFTSNQNTAASTMTKYFCMLNLPTWRLMLHPDRGFGSFNGFFDQSKIRGGTDSVLGRIFLAGNLVCLHPNQNIFLSNMS